MKKKLLSVGVILTIASSMLFTSCIGSFALTNKVLAWNKQVSSKFVNELIFVACNIIPVYPLALAADAIVLNSIEFWSGNNPVTAETKIIDGKDAKYQIDRNSNGYKITNLADNTTVSFIFNSDNNSWSLESDGNTYELLQFVDENHVKMAQGTVVELSNEGILAYQNSVIGQNFVCMK